MNSYSNHFQKSEVISLHVEYSIFLLQQRVSYFSLPEHVPSYEYGYLIYIIGDMYQWIRHCNIVLEARAC